MFLVAVLGLIAVLVILDYVFKLQKRKLIVNIPGPAIYPLIGNLLFLTQRKSEDLIKNVIRYTETFGSTVAILGGNQRIVVTVDPIVLKTVLSNPQLVDKSSFYKMVTPWLRNSLLTCSAKDWHPRRKAIIPSYHFEILEQFVDVFDKQSNILARNLKPRANDSGFDIYPLVTAATLDIAGGIICKNLLSELYVECHSIPISWYQLSETSMNTQINAQSGLNREYVKAVEEMSDIIMTRVTNIRYNNDLVFHILAPALARRQRIAKKSLHDFTNNIIQERRKVMLQEQSKGIKYDPVTDETGQRRKMALLDFLLQSTIDGTLLNDSEILEEIDGFIFGSYDTTAVAISFCLYNVSRNPHVQKKLYEEVCQVLVDNEPITLNKLNELKYMELVIKESLRVFPPVPFIGRKAMEDVVINNQRIPAGTEIIIPIFAVHKNPEIFPDPGTFIPERHLPANIVDKSLYAFTYMPFSAGPRNCIGQKFAMLEMKCVISKVLKYFEVLPVGEAPRLQMNLTVRSLNGVQIGMKLRSQ